ncbi:MAG: hypothetical protein Q7W30_07355 [Coriobacteriia bacterium]|nr:hypothetical protein [Coriobacteriia bacterium]
MSPTSVEARVVFSPGEPLRTSASARDRALALLPGLRTHRCDNDAGLAFGDELADTEIAHLLEHATLEVMAMAGSPVDLRGTTSWDFAADGPGIFRVSVAYDDDLVALGALKAAEEAVRWCLADSGAAPGIEAEARRLRGLRGR